SLGLETGEGRLQKLARTRILEVQGLRGIAVGGQFSAQAAEIVDFEDHIAGKFSLDPERNRIGVGRLEVLVELQEARKPAEYRQANRSTRGIRVGCDRAGRNRYGGGSRRRGVQRGGWRAVEQGGRWGGPQRGSRTQAQLRA